MNKYQNGKIYKIVCRITNLIYIGSTVEKYLSNRLKGHRSRFNIKKDNTTSFKVLENNDYYIELIELFPCTSRDELLVRERYYFDLIDCVNKVRPKRTEEEKKQQHYKACKIYRENNRNKINEWYQNNKDRILEERKKYFQQNKEKITEKNKQYRLKMKELTI
jgi:hypothetical protein